jgi:hypothetical protein
MSDTARDEHNGELGYGRTQPEFSLGERLATMEAENRKDEQYSTVILELGEKLNDQKLENVRTEMRTKDTGQKEAITKAEAAASERAAALATELRQFTDQAQTRFGALERGGAGLSGEKLGSGDFRTNLYIIVAVLTLVYLVASGHVH